MDSAEVDVNAPVSPLHACFQREVGNSNDESSEITSIEPASSGTEEPPNLMMKPHYIRIDTLLYKSLTQGSLAG